MNPLTTPLVQLGLNGGLVALLVLALALTPGKALRNGGLRLQLVLGLVFGLVAILAMNASFTPAPGVSIDMRTVICSVSAFSVGPVAGLVTLVLTALYRLSLSGQGLLAGLGIMVTVTALGWAWREAHLRRHCGQRLALVGLAVSVPLAALGWTFALPEAVYRELLPRLLLPVPLAFATGVLLLGGLIDLLQQRAATEQSLEQANEALRRSRDRLSLAIESSGDGRWEWNLRDASQVYHGPLYRQLGLDGPTGQGNMDDFWALVHPDDLAPARATVDDYVNNRVAVYNVQFRLRDLQGRWRWILSRGQATERDQRGQVWGMAGMHFDQTAQREAEQAAQVEQAKFAGIFQTLPDSAGTTRISDGRFIEVNPAFERLLGYSRDEAVGRTSVELGIWSSVGERARLLAEFARAGRVDRLPLVAQAKNGRLIPGQVSAHPAQIDGEACFVMVFRDLSHEKQVEDDLMFSTASLDAAGRMGRLGAWVIYYGGTKPDYWSPVCREITGLGADEPVPQDFSERFVLSRHRQSLRELERRCKEQLLGWDIELEIQRADGQHLWLRVMAEPVSEQGKLLYIRGLMQDIDASRRNLDRLRQSEEKFSGIFKFLPEAMAIIEQNGGKFLDVNPAWEALTGHSRAQAIGKDPVQIGLLSATQREQVRQAWVRDGRADDDEIEITTRSGELRTTLVSMRPMEVDGVPCWISVRRDITERRNTQARVLEREQQLSLTVQAANLGMWDWDLRNGKVSGNRRWRELRGLDLGQDSVDGDRILATLHPEDRPLVAAAVRAHLKNSQQDFDVVARCVSPDGSLRWVRDLGKVVTRDTNGRALRMLGLNMDVTEQRQQQDRLQQMAHYDALTGLPNRVLLADRMKQAMAQAERTGDLLGVVYLDLDGFKPVNDRLGHGAGDQLLVQIAQRLSHATRASDSVARLGGDEFVLLLAALTSEHDCVLAIERAMQAICMPYQVAGEQISVTASMGATLYPGDPGDADTLLRHADQAMYSAKQAGRNRFHFFDAGQEQATRSRNQRIGALRDALHNGEFVLYLQPKVNMRSGEVTGAEALARWEHPTRGLLAPADFLTDIEGSELNTAFGEWVIDSALAVLEGWHRLGLELSLSINITARHLQSPAFSQALAVRLLAYPLVQANRLEIEVTESGSLSDLNAAVATIDRLHQLGVRLALDDFGTGYSSLTYLRRLPVDTLKIDQSFVRDMLLDPDDRAIVQAVISLAQSFGRNVIAEGVETAEQGALLLQMGCLMAQGYGIARPLPPAALLPWMAQWQPDVSWRETCPG